MKRVFCLLLCLGLLLACALPELSPSAQAADGDEIRAAKKIISVVCDDSGSMSGDKWTYANFATQSLIAQLNEHDELYITFMSDPSNAIKVDMSNIKAEVQAMENHNCGGVTPFDAIKTGYDRLVSIPAADSSTQYWLIITTDGSVSGIPNDKTMHGTTQSVLDAYKGTKMSNGSRLNVAYLAIGSNLGCKADPANSLYTYTASDPKGISTALADICNLISSRVKATNLTLLDNQTIAFESKLPIYSFSILSQQSAAIVEGASADSGGLHVLRNIPLKKDSLFGNAALVSAPKNQGQNQVIPAGRYVISFSQKVDLDDLLIQYEPAIGVKMVIRSGGQICNDPSSLAVGTHISVEMIPVIPGTDTPIDPAVMPAGINWRIVHIARGQEQASANSTILGDTQVLPDNNIIRGYMQIPGFSELVFEEQFNLMVRNYGIFAVQPDDPTYPRLKLEKAITPDRTITFTLTNDGNPMTAEDLRLHGIGAEIVNVKVNNSAISNFLMKGNQQVPVELQQNADGTFSLILKPTAAMSIFPFIILSGEYTVQVAVSYYPNLVAEGTFTLVPSWQDYLIILQILCGLFLLYWLLAILCKRKFSGQTVVVKHYTLYSDGTSTSEHRAPRELTVFSGGALYPSFKPCKYKDPNTGVVLIADQDNAVIVSGRSIEKATRFKKYGISSADPATHLGRILRSLSRVESNGPDNNTERTATDSILAGTNDLLYLATQNNENIYSINIL